MIAWLIRLITGARAQWIESDENNSVARQRIYFANHSSNLDAPLIWASLPTAVRQRTRPVAAKDYWDANPLRRWLANQIFHCVLIERKNRSAHVHPLAAAENALEAGDSLIIFPEGTRVVDADLELNPFKPGIWHLAKKHPQVDLVPVHLENMNRILPKGDFILVPLIASISLGSPIYFDANESKEDFLSRAKTAIEKLAARGQK